MQTRNAKDIWRSWKKKDELNRSLLKRKMLLSILTHPVVVVPFVSGVTAMVGSWVLNIHPEMGLFIGVAGILGAVGACLTLAALASDTHVERAMNEVVGEAKAKRDKTLNQLDQNLSSLGDRHVNGTLSDLRAVAQTLDDVGKLDAAKADAEFHLGAMDLYDQCVRSLECCVSLGRIQRGTHAKGAKDEIGKQIAKIVGVVRARTQQLRNILVQLQAGTVDAAGLHDALESCRTAAEQADGHRHAFETEFDGLLSR